MTVKMLCAGSIAELERDLSIIDDGKERKVPTGFIDITARDRDGTTVAIELKSDHQRAQCRAFFDKACVLSLEGIVSKRLEARRYTVHARIRRSA